MAQNLLCKILFSFIHFESAQSLLRDKLCNYITEGGEQNDTVCFRGSKNDGNSVT